MRLEVLLPLLCLAQVWAQTCLKSPDVAFTDATKPCPAQAAVGTHCTLMCAAGYGIRDNGQLSYTCTALVNGGLTPTAASWLPDASTTACVACTAGRYSANNMCVECASGTTSAAGASSCVNVTGCDPSTTCSGHGSCPVPGVAGSNNCICEPLFTGSNCGGCVSGAGTFPNCACQPGSRRVVTSNTVTCTPCEAGTISTQTNADSCTPCPPGQYASQNGLTQCGVCSIPQYSLSGASQCSNCPQGSASVQDGASQCTPTCGRGNMMVNGQCTPCPVGTYSSTDIATSQCTACPAGRFAGQTGTPECTPCPVNTYTPTENYAKCVNCSAGYITTSTGQTVCTPATQVCDRGYYFTVDSVICVPCAAGKYFTTSTSGANPGTNTIPCMACDAGKYSTAAPSFECAPCPTGSYQDTTGKSACINCASGKTTLNTGATVCSDIPSLVCGPGTYLDTATQSCESCDMGTYSNTKNAAMCQPCDKGTYNDATGASVCKTCLANTFAASTGLTTCYQCQTNTVSNAGAWNCTTYPVCPAGSVWNGQSCAQCAPGHVAPLSSVVDNPSIIRECTACLAGSYQDGTGATECRLCPAGTKASDPGASSCKACDQGTYTSAMGQSACIPCPTGFTSASPATSCVSQGTTPAPDASNNCPPGTFAVTKDGVNQCKFCEPGTFNPQASVRACIVCPAGSFAYNNGSLSCTVCPLGTRQPNTGMASCIKCETGRYASVVGSTACLSCADNPTVAATIPDCGSATCNPACTNGKVCRFPAGTTYAAPQCYEDGCNPACTANVQACSRGQCIPTTVPVSTPVANVFDNLGLDASRIVANIDISSVGTDPVLVPSDAVTSITVAGSHPPVSYGTGNGDGDAAATLVVSQDISTPTIDAKNDNSILVVGANVDCKNVTVGNGPSGSTLTISFDNTAGTDKKVTIDKLNISPDGQMAVSGTGVVQVNQAQGSAISTQGTEVKGELRGTALVVLPTPDGTKDTHVNNLTTDSDIIGADNVDVDGTLKLTGSGKRVDGTIRVNDGGRLTVTANVNVSRVEMKDNGKTTVDSPRPTPTTEPLHPHIDVIVACTINHTIEFKFPDMKNSNDLNTKKSTQTILTYGPNTDPTQFECGIDFIASNGDRVHASVSGGKVTPARRLLSGSCQNAQWGAGTLDASTCGDNAASPTIAKSLPLVFVITLLSLLALF